MGEVFSENAAEELGHEVKQKSTTKETVCVCEFKEKSLISSDGLGRK